MLSDYAKWSYVTSDDIPEEAFLYFVPGNDEIGTPNLLIVAEKYKQEFLEMYPNMPHIRDLDSAPPTVPPSAS